MERHETTFVRDALNSFALSIEKGSHSNAVEAGYAAESTLRGCCSSGIEVMEFIRTSLLWPQNDQRSFLPSNELMQLAKLADHRWGQEMGRLVCIFAVIGGIQSKAAKGIKPSPMDILKDLKDYIDNCQESGLGQCQEVRTKEYPVRYTSRDITPVITLESHPSSPSLHLYSQAPKPS
ncbi:MAG: hypothetical protein P4M13_01490 [Alphaproteobacteria bacterium]|nr:hypothetical protein [Alphaproteobacteria bacterium]